MKKIIFYNTIKKNREGFVKECEAQKVPYETMRTRHVIIDLANGREPIFVHKNKPFRADDAYNYFQLRGKEGQTPSLMTYYFMLKNIPFNDPINIHHTAHVNKISQMLMMNVKNIPIPGSIILNRYAYKKNRNYIINNIKFPCVLKINEDRGQGVWKINSIKELDERMEEKMTAPEYHEKHGTIEMFIIQEYIPNTHDFRVTMHEGEVLGVIKRSSTDGFYNNWSRGATFEYVDVTEEEKKLSQKACEACGIDMAGVDFVRKEDGTIAFFEINKAPQFNKDYSELVARRIIGKYLK